MLRFNLDALDLIYAGDGADIIYGLLQLVNRMHREIYAALDYIVLRVGGEVVHADVLLLHEAVDDVP